MSDRGPHRGQEGSAVFKKFAAVVASWFAAAAGPMGPATFTGVEHR